jgi:hypothetical protein
VRRTQSGGHSPHSNLVPEFLQDENVYTWLTGAGISKML